MKKFKNIKLLNEMLNMRYLPKTTHPLYDIWIYKYSQSAVFERMWNEVTLSCRGLVMDEEYNLINNCMEKFFNIEELDILGIELPNCGYKVYDKLDGSLIEVFKYKGNVVVATAGSFESAQAKVAEQMLWDKYFDFVQNIVDGKTYLFEFIYPLNKIVVNYESDEKLVLLAVRDLDGNEEDIEIYKNLGLDVAESFNLSIEDLMFEKNRKDFINREGFIIRFDNGFRVKVKYSEYVRLHKLLSNVNEKFVWEFLKDGQEIVLDNVPDETFEFIKKTKKMFLDKFESIKNEVEMTFVSVYAELCNKYGKDNFGKKEFAMTITPRYKKLSGMLFRRYELREYDDIIWKQLKPKYEEGKGGFQSMKEA